ncbi:Os09g0472801 [Oryza sativa Japonica Group]|uniref:Os09g0472801 protein n=1 Tax=Oryza sativa subsp. japonica TaxID=39947 RepID=A0A0P0XNY0_ORYSJ|nr:Os09g0472801 [Oryza sativa Japonica Group]
MVEPHWWPPRRWSRRCQDLWKRWHLAVQAGEEATPPRTTGVVLWPSIAVALANVSKKAHTTRPPESSPLPPCDLRPYVDLTDGVDSGVARSPPSFDGSSSRSL